MSKQYLLGTDIGTQGTKTVIVHPNGQIITSAFSEYDVIKLKPTWAEQWPEVWVQATLETIKKAIEKSGIKPAEVAGIALSGLYGGSGIPVDQTMKPLRPCLIWMDRRATEEVQWVKDNVDKNKIFSITGNYVDSYYGFTKMMWIKNNEPEIWQKTFQFITPKDYVIYKLTGENIIDLSSAGNIGGIFDINKRTWSEEMSEILGISLSKLPQQIVKSADIVGKITPEASRLCGLLAGTPVVAGGIDAPVASLSAGVLEEKSHVAMAGTSICWGVVHKGQHLSPKLVSFPYVAYDEEMIYTFGGAATAGGIVRWFRDQFGEKELAAEKELKISAYRLLDQEAEKISPGSEGLLLLPYFMGERSPIWDPDAKGTIIGLTLYHNRKHLYRAILEGVAYSLRHNIEAGLESGLKLAKDCIMVGGATKSPLWIKIFSDVTGFPIKTLKQDVEAPYGDALLAGVGTGAIDSYQKIKDWVQFNTPVYPDKRVKKIYDQYFVEYIQAYELLKDMMKRLGRIK
ncbi:MAG: FGGY-family carbohydrate kinase [Candidatus Caldatribacteriota bacterium]